MALGAAAPFALRAQDTTRAAPRTACDSPCKAIHLPLVIDMARPVPLSDPLGDLQRQVGPANRDTAGRVHLESKLYTASQVEKQASLAPGSPQAAYPADLKAKGIGGEVVASFVVDTAGNVEMETLRILMATQAAFTDAVRAALPAMTFTPARIGKTAVRQVVERAFTFTVKPPAPAGERGQGTVTLITWARYRAPDSSSVLPRHPDIPTRCAVSACAAR
jgi:TonB family protein